MLFRSKWLDQISAENLALTQRTAAQAATIVELERQLATERARFEWLTVHVNELKTERALLFDRVLEVQIPVMQIARATPVEEPPVVRRPTQADLRGETAFMPVPQGERGRIFRPDPEPKDISAQVAEAMAAGDLFNDVGDDRARELGLGWDQEGALAVDVPRAVAAATR